MSYKYDATQANEYGLIEEGTYEVILEKAETKTLPSGKEKIAIMFRIRTDIEQPFQNRVLFEDIWKERDTEFFNRKRLNMLMGTQKFENGKTFASIAELLDELIGSFLQIKVVKTYDDYKQEEVNSISYYRSSEHKPQAVSAAKEPAISDEDIPF
jgi:hypothetical protein